MPVTVCDRCGARWAQPSGWIAHLETCSPTRLHQVVGAVTGLIGAIAFTVQTQAGERGQKTAGGFPTATPC